MASESIGRQIELAIQGDVKWDEETLEVYSTNQSMYRVKPMLVAFPKDENDVVEIVKIAGTKCLWPLSFCF